MVGRRLQIIDIIRNFLSKLINKEFLVFLFFLLLSGLFWLTNVLDDSYEKEFAVPIRLSGVPKNVILTGEIDSVVKVVVRDKGYVIGSYIFDGGFRSLSFDFENCNRSENTGEIFIADIQRMLAQQMYSSSKIVSVKANNLIYSYNHGRNKKVPVRLQGKITPAEGYYLARVQFIPDSVTIYASKKLLDSIQYVYTERMEVSNFNEITTQKVRIAKIKNAKALPNQVKVQFYPDILTEEDVEVPIQAINVPADKNMRVFPGKMKVKFAVGSQRLRSMPKNIETRELLPDGFKLVVDYKEVANGSAEKCHVYLQAAPNGIRNAHPVVNVVDYLIEQK
ncbi:YbbR-like domain-containing protein [Prevotella aurantiaca]|jgi:ybbR-like protein|uniref:YbbR-like domain-containing protein n=1 Tax=Prevotella aurantiaca TaxID=596085 RepID=UPI001CB5CA96|nr:YbbR-like domain-containing protein [Prevotella aurantiaca]MBF1386468.1 YbbR-like domain-containing protein [Prevotella aurantiaca]